MSNPMLEIENLHVEFETEDESVQAVDGISFEIHPGEVYGIVGESGSGKSVTALSIMALLDSNANVTADRVRFDGTDLLSKTDSEMRSIRGGEISMIFQDPMNSLNPVITVGEQIAEVVRHHGDVNESTNLVQEMRRKYVTGTSADSASWRRAVELLETVGIPDPETRAQEYPHQLSGGMRQRVMIAQALAGDPSLILADEPTTALDVSIEAQILNQLLDLRDEFGVSVLLITHDLGVVRETCDRVAVMYAGELMEKAAVEELFEDPQHPYTRGLMQSIPRLTDDREMLDVIEGSVPNLAAKPPGCPFQDRCAWAFEACTQPLEEHEVDPGHDVACHLHREDIPEELGEWNSPTAVRTDGGDDR